MAGEHRLEIILLQDHVGDARLCQWKTQCTFGETNKIKNRDTREAKINIYFLKNVFAHPLQELCSEMESKLHTYTDVKNAIHRMLENSNVARGSTTEHNLSILQQKWASVYSKVQERKVI